MHTKLIVLLALLTALPGLALDRQTAIGILEQACMSCVLWEQGPLPSLEAAQLLESQLLMILDEYGEELVVTTDLSHLPPEAANHDMNSQAGVVDYNALVAARRPSRAYFSQGVCSGRCDLAVCSAPAGYGDPLGLGGWGAMPQPPELV